MDYIIKSIGALDIYIDKENKVTIKDKKGKDVSKQENVTNAYRTGNIVYIYLKNGD